MKISSFITAFCLLACTSVAQNPDNNFQNNYRAVHWGLDEGLSHGVAYHMIKDANGFLWIGTQNGLNRFDGNSFKVYTHQRNNNKSLMNDDARGGLVEDSLHNIWIGTNAGLSRYNVRTEDFTNFLPDTTLKSFTPVAIPFWATKNEVFCIESESVLAAYDIHSSAKRTLAYLGEYKESFIGIAVAYSVFDSSTNSIWSLTENPEGKVGLLQIMLSTKQKYFFAFQYHRKKNSQGFAEDLCYDAPRKCIWINSTEGLLQFTLSDKKFHHIDALYKYERVKEYTRFVGITLDKQDRVWFTTDPKGIIVYNPADESVNFPFPADSALQQEVSANNACLYCDRDNIIWSGFWINKGIDELVPYSPVITHYTANQGKYSLSSNSVSTVVDAGKGKMWAGTGKGINILDTKTGTFQVLEKKDLPGIQTPDGFIVAAVIDTLAQKALLLTTAFFKMDMLTRKCTPVVFKSLDNQVTSLAGIPAYDGSEIFFTGYNNKGQHVFVLNLNNDTAHEILSFPGLSFNVSYTVPVKNHLLFLQGYADEKGNRTYENKNGKWQLIHTPIDSMRWTYMVYIKENNTYWIAGENQLFHFDSSFHIAQIYSAENGLPELPIAGLINDDNGNIWFYTDRSIHELNIVTGQIKTMSEIDGFEKQNFELLPWPNKDANGNIYYSSGGTGVGFIRITPDNFISTVSGVYLKSLSIGQALFPLKASINYTDTLSLNYDQTKIEIETGIVDFYSKGRSRLRYKLEGTGINENWHYAPYYYTIRYDGLQPGNYKLIMQASNASNEFKGQERILFINISPAFWNTWWFRVIVAICVIVLVYGLIRWRLQQKFKLRFRQMERENQMAELKQQTAELEMQALRSQMNPHFIFNCLSSINSFILKNKTEEASKYLTKFSRLIRMVLNNSKEAFISLEDELETLRLYLDMEKLRFKNAFDYGFNFKNAFEAENIFIPPLLLQPFAENAIWHGLMHKQGIGFLNFDLSAEEKLLTCVITDNGVGRQKVEMLKTRSAENRKSMGLKITTERLNLLNNNPRERTVFTIEDLADENGNALGTRIHLKIYYKEIMELHHLKQVK